MSTQNATAPDTQICPALTATQPQKKGRPKVAAAHWQAAAGEKRNWVDESEPQSETFSVEEDNDLDSSPDYQVRHNSSLHRS